jgi:hypothetical protein
MIITREVDPALYSTLHTEIVKQTKNLNRNYHIDISIILAAGGENHDRRIFTNYYSIESNNSFTYFNKQGKVKKVTSMHSYPSFMIAFGNEMMLYKNLNTLAEIKSIVEERAQQRKVPASEITNRLLSMVVE